MQAQEKRGTAAGLVTVASENDVPTTVARLAEAAEGAGLAVFGIVDHQAGAATSAIRAAVRR